MIVFQEYMAIAAPMGDQKADMIYLIGAAMDLWRRSFLWPISAKPIALWKTSTG